MFRRLVLSIVLLLVTFPLLASAQVHVNGYFRRDGTYVQPHYRTAPDGNPFNNWSATGPQRGLDPWIILHSTPPPQPVDPYALQRGMLLGQEIRMRQLQIEMMQRQLHQR